MPLKDIKRRIKSIESVIKVTKAMYIISSSRMKKFQEETGRVKEFQNKIEEILGSIPKNDVQENIFFNKKQKSKTILLFTYSPQRGLAGALPGNLFRAIHDFIEKKNSEGIKTLTINIGNRLSAKIRNLEAELLADFRDIPEKPSTSDVRSLISFIENHYIKGEASEVYIAFPELITQTNQKPSVKKILPVEAKIKQHNQAFTYGHNLQTLVDGIMNLYLQNILYLGKIETTASEYSARMMAMKTASDNAGEIKENLNLEYNISRQSQITAEIAQISASADVLVF